MNYKSVVKDLARKAEAALQDYKGFLNAIRVLEETYQGGREKGQRPEKVFRAQRKRHVKYSKTCGWGPCGAKFTARKSDTRFCPDHRAPRYRVLTPSPVKASKPHPKGVKLFAGDPLKPKEGTDGKQ